MDRHLYAYREITLPWRDVVRTLTDHRGDLFGAATDATVQGATTQVHTTIAGVELGTDVAVRMGPVRELGMHTVSMALTWDALEGNGIFPRMLGSIEVTAMSDHPPRTQVTFLGSYHPPMGILGTAVDAVAGHKIAEDTVEHFLEELCSRLVELTPTG